MSTLQRQERFATSPVAMQTESEHPVSFYVRTLKRRLPRNVFKADLGRLTWLPIHLAVIILGTIGITVSWMPWPIIGVLSLLIGLSFAGLMFLGHETLHGGVVRGRLSWLKPIVGWIAFAPFAVAQKLWVVWHNRMHHGNTNRIEIDPDMYPSLDEYNDGAYFSVDNFSLGGRRWRGSLSLLLGFLVKSKKMLLVGRSRLGMTTREYRQALLETLLAVLLWAAVAYWIGLIPFLFAFVVPHLIANVVVMGFILTNHCLSPATETNDPLINSMSVTTPRWIEWLTLDFGYHVEHHLFPSMSGRHARCVRDEIMNLWPERYQTMPLLRALRALHETGRVYENATTLSDPKSGGSWPTTTPAPRATSQISVTSQAKGNSEAILIGAVDANVV